MEEPVRVRVVFDDRKMLTKSQRSEGLKRCWLLLNPCIATISDLESHVRTSFNLKDSCPHGLVLSMDDFVLPPFESACVLKDKDIIRVRKKDAPQFGVIDLGDDPCYIQDSGDVEKQYTVSSDKLLAIREFDEDSGHKRINDEDLCAHNDNAIDTGTPLKLKKKRKHSDGIQGAKNVQVEENVGGSTCETHDGSMAKVGDVLAYHLTELSSSRCPEVSSFRVGQVTSYDYVSMSIILAPVPEYPIFSDEDIERRDSMLQANSSPYNEVGSLQIHYPSLVDVRLLKGSDSEATTSDYPGVETISTQGEAPVNNWELAVVQTSTNSTVTQRSTQETVPVNNWEVAVVNSKAKETVVRPTANGSAGVSTWDRIKQALNEKKAQLQQKKKDGWDEWTPSKSTASTSWSYRALRRSAVGPTLAYLRGRNDKRPRGK